MSKHSFIVQANIPDTSHDARLLFSAEAEMPLPVADVDAAVAAFVNAATWGMFSLRPASPKIPMEVAGSESGERYCKHVLLARGIQPFSYRVLLNMLRKKAAIARSMSVVRIASLDPGGSCIGAGDLRAASWSISAQRSAAFALRSRRNLRDCREPVIRIEFQETLSDADLVRVAPAFLAWDELVARGGFQEAPEADDESGAQGTSPSQQTYLSSPRVIEHLLYGYTGEADGFNALVNLTARMHALYRPVSALEIE